MTEVSLFRPERVQSFFVSVQYKGRRERFLGALDTGATLSVIPWDVADYLGIKVDGETKRVSITTASSRETAPMITIDEMEVLGQRVEQVPAIIHDLPADGIIDGLIGLSFLHHFDIFLGYRKGILTID